MNKAAEQKRERFILWRIMDVLEKIFCTIPVVLMTIVVFAAVICRYVLKSPFGWSEEFTLICTACKDYWAWGTYERTPYCPNCGASMENEEYDNAD